MPATFHAAPAADADTLVVLLPGLGDGPADYVANGFVDRIQAANPSCDVIAADAHIGYYRTRTFLPRLAADVIDPAADRYDSIWLVGISLGGFGSAIYAADHADTIDGLILLAPYMGDHGMIAQISDAGGLARWNPPAEIAAIEDDEQRKYHELWAFFRDYVTAPESQPDLYIGWGTDDSLDVPNGFVAEVLPPEHSATLPGGHRWTVWKPLFAELVERAFGQDG